MLDNAPTSQDVVAQLLQRVLDERGLSAKDLSLQLGQNRDYVAGRLRHEIRMTLDFLDRVCAALDLTVTDLFSQIYPFDAAAKPVSNPPSARLLIRSLRSDGESPLAPTRLRQLAERGNVLRADIDRRPVPDDFPTALIRNAEPIIQLSFSKAVAYYLFWLEECLGHRPGTVERTVKYPALLGSLATLLVNRRTDMMSLGRHLLLHALDIAEVVDDATLDAYLDERAAVLLWNAGLKDEALELLQQPKLILHPMLDSYYNYLGMVHFIGFQNLDQAMACFDQALTNAQSVHVRYSAIQQRALILAQTETYEAAVEELGKARILALPDKLEWHLRFTEARICRIVGDRADAIDQLLSILGDDRLPRQDTELMAFLFIELLSSDPPQDTVAMLFDTICEVHDSLDPIQVHHRSMRQALAEDLKRFALAAPSTKVRSNIIPNS